MTIAVLLNLENTNEKELKESRMSTSFLKAETNITNRFWVAQQGVTDKWEDGDDL